MSNTISLLDCTLREAPVDSLLWGDEFIEKFIFGLEEANVDIIEIGFLKDTEYKEGSTIFNTPNQIERYIPLHSKSQYVALVDYGRFDVDTLAPNNGRTIDGIRICFKKEEKDVVFDYAKKIIEKGYWVSIQQVDTRGYSDDEILRVIEKVNELKPKSYSIVDTFGSLYEEDAEYLYKLINHNLDKNIALGFHAHNNLMLAASNSQRFITDLCGIRKLIVDGSVHGCGRGAGNAHTELLAEYINLKHFGKYDINKLLDIIDDILPELMEKGKWGYSIPYFIAGIHSSHVFNVDFLLSRHNIRSRDLRDIINQLDDKSRRKYDYPLLEKIYVDHFDHTVDDTLSKIDLGNEIGDRKVLVIAPGQSINKFKDNILKFIEEKNVFIIHLNTVIEGFPYDRVFCSSQKRMDACKINKKDEEKWIVTSNLYLPNHFSGKVMDYRSLLKFGWINIDNAGVLALRLLKSVGVKNIYVAGFDGYNYEKATNFYSISMQKEAENYVIDRMNKDIREMIEDIIQNSDDQQCNVKFITPSRYVQGRKR